jgi:HTH-type transcriptional regulator, quorum sensing regulator NprR
LTNQNLGYLYSTIGDTKEAIKFFNEVIKDEEVQVSGRLMALTNLIKEYYRIQNHEKAQEMIIEAERVLELAKNDVYYKLYYYIIHTYTYAINDQHEKFTSLVTEEFIPYLRKQKDYANLIVYSNMVAKHFETVGRYKDSVKYYKLANLAYEEVVNL